MAALSLTVTSGCSGVLMPVAAVSGPVNGIGQQLAYSERIDSMVLGWRNKAWAHHAWNCRKHMYVDRACYAHFGHGFCQGYRDVAAGGNGCVPAIPPRGYWSWRYQTAEGQAKVAAWFDGYPAGAMAAAEDGAANWSQIQVSPQIEAQYAARGIGPPPNGAAPGMPGTPGGFEDLPADEVPLGPMGLPPLAPEAKKQTPKTPTSPRLTNDLRPTTAPAVASTARLPAAQPAVATAARLSAAQPATVAQATGNPLRGSVTANTAAALPASNYQNALRNPFDQVAVPVGFQPAMNASLIPVSQGPTPVLGAR